MSTEDDLVSAVRPWIVKAEEDFSVAARLLRPAHSCPVQTVGFHAQQCVEKYLKALMTWRQIEFPKTHNLAELVALLPARLALGIRANEQNTLTAYAAVMRYPGDYAPMTYEQAQAAVRIARSSRQAVRKLLPWEALGEHRSMRP